MSIPARRLRDLRAAYFQGGYLSRDPPQASVGTSAVRILSDQSINEVVFQNLGPGTLVLKAGAAPANITDGNQVSLTGTLKASGAKAKADWWALADSAGTKVAISVRQ